MFMILYISEPGDPGGYCPVSKRAGVHRDIRHEEQHGENQAKTNNTGLMNALVWQQIGFGRYPLT